TAAMAFYGYLGYFLSQRYPAKAAYIRLVMVVVILLVGASRLYLGVHFPSDVLGGYILGGFCLLLGIEVSERFRSSSSH
ncbi:MAG: phosphatase PAP2 family protein, partial [Patescibacteria group bacterium]|nr:phosphatase PAP2 family protein [Patescibacteria group bacterium]